jgi:archaeosine-15-forming tRNA-guanine transglycosylase
MSTANVAVIMQRLVYGEEVTTEELNAVILHCQRMVTQPHRVLADHERLATVKLRDGRVVDLFPTGTVHVYTPDLVAGYELALPQTVTGEARPIPIG